MSKRTFFIIFTITTILGITAGNYFSSLYIKQRLIGNLSNQYTNQQQSIANEVAKTLENEVANVTQKLTLIAQIPEIRDGDTDVCNQKLEEVFNTLGKKLGNLGRINQEGVFQCSLNKTLVGVPGAKLGSYVTDIFQDPEHHPVMSRSIVPPGITSNVVAVHVPVYDENNVFIGTIGGAIYFDQITQKYLQDIKLDEGGFVILLDDDGTILSHFETDLIGKKATDPKVVAHLNPEMVYQDIVAEALTNRQGYRNYSFDSLDKIGVFAPVEIFADREWVVLVAVPVESINRTLVDVEVEKLFSQSMLGSTVIAFGAGLSFLLLMIYSIFNPISTITKAAEKISHGNLAIKVNISSRDEVGKLARAFNQMTTELKKSYDELEEKVRQRTKQLEVANEKLKQLDKLKDEFVSVASHELRTPMTAIKGFLSMILEGEYGQVPTKLQQPLQDVYVSTERLIHLVGDMLNVSRIEAGRLKFELTEIELGPLVEQVTGSLQPLAKQKQVKLNAKVETTPKIQADKNKVQQILLNLLGNALKFTDKGEIILSVIKKGDRVELAVTDSGIGISQTDQARLFTKFTQLTTQEAGRPAGTGLGLYIARELAQKMGGDLLLTFSELGKGSIFTLTLPITDSVKAKQVKQEIQLEAATHLDQK